MRALVLIMLLAPSAFSQTGDGTLVGTVYDAQQAVLPGVTITAASPALQGERTTISDERGYFRLLNLPPGEYTVTAELPGFSTHKRGGIAVRAGATFTVNITLQVSALTDEITVTAESPMVETSSAATNLLLQGEFQRDIPLQGRRNWSDMLEMVPGLNARPFDDNSGRMTYYGRGAHHWSQVIKIDG
ncbi:MAG: carboxypeptidase regulatory-like domain-containing protein, partial [Acidobacteria bacterium]|nr:carboxypeptidase regulatory-like domain-containing protein [Acidobacteriota bacterium]